MNTQQAYINGFVKRASEYGFNEDEAVGLLKKAETREELERYDQAKMTPAIAALMSGSLPTIAYGAYKDYKNRDINPWQDELSKIEPDKLFSKERAEHYKNRSALDMLLDAQVKKGLIGLGAGGLAGLAAGGLSKALGSDAIPDPGLAGLFGAGVGGLGGMMYGSYSGANRYNDMIKDRMAENKKHE